MEASALKREKIIIRTSITGIVTNVLLATFKLVTGLIANSIAVVLDGVNNYSDALSSVITIIGPSWPAESRTGSILSGTGGLSI